MRVLVVGDRTWRDGAAIEAVLRRFPIGTLIIHGGAPGAESVVDDVARRLRLRVLIFWADWRRLGKAAGPNRNQRMIDEGRPDLVLAFHQNFQASKGIKDLLRRAEAADIPIELYPRAEAKHRDDL